MDIGKVGAFCFLDAMSPIYPMSERSKRLLVGKEALKAWYMNAK